MTRAMPEIQRRCRRYMQEAQAAGYHAQSLICDTAITALIEDGYTPEQADRAAQVVWTQHFAIYGPN